MSDKAPPEPTDMERWACKHNIETVKAEYDNDGMGMKSWVHFVLITDDLSWPKRENKRETKRISEKTFNDLYEFNSRSHPMSLVVVKPGICEKVAAYDLWEAQNKKDLAELKRLRKKLGMSDD